MPKKIVDYLYINYEAFATILSWINTLQNVIFVQQTASLPPCGTSLKWKCLKSDITIFYHCSNGSFATPSSHKSFAVFWRNCKYSSLFSVWSYFGELRFEVMKSTAVLDSVNNTFACWALALPTSPPLSLSLSLSHTHTHTHIFARAYKNPHPQPPMHAVTHSIHTFNKTEETRDSVMNHGCPKVSVMSWNF